ncbi:MAG: hypothetical protein KKF89_04450 [Nanoarchaeota archaeon]|nr:hypothetical protein [Nanoarchaeota archaeon]MBU1854944.1 hypothetical protein [Nanoarchaeota archaeon]
MNIDDFVEETEKTQNTICTYVCKAGNWLKNYPALIKNKRYESTAFIASFLPFYIVNETTYGNLTDWISFKSRLGNTLAQYLIIPGALEGREKFKQTFRLTKESSKWKHGLADLGYGILLATIIRPLIYYLSGERNLNNIFKASWPIILGTAILAPIALFVADNFKYLLGKGEPENTPIWLQQKSEQTKKNIVYGFLALSLTASAMIYQATPDKLWEFNNEKDKQEITTVNNQNQQQEIIYK